MLLKTEHKSIPRPAIARLCKVYSLIDELESGGIPSISSSEIGKRIGARPHSIRKDISFLGETGTSGSGYDTAILKKNIEERLGLREVRDACVIGLGGFGQAILNSVNFADNFTIAAGFDSNINRIETIKTDIPVYPTYEIEPIVKGLKIELAVITDPGHAARKVVDSLVAGGIRGIVNFSPIVIGCDHEEVFISNMDLIGEFRYLSALLTLHRNK